jgi:hypothetical protein
MFRHALLAAAALLFIPREDANAIPVTLRIDSRVGLGCGGCAGFAEETGLQNDAFHDVFALLSFDTSVAPNSISNFSASYLLDQPGAKLSVFVGAWSAHYYSTADLRLYGELGSGGPCDGLTVRSHSLAGERGSVFNTSNCRNPETKLPDYSLDAFVNSLSGFTGTPFDTVINQKITGVSTWWLQGHVRSVTRVPEPTTLWLVCAGLLGLAASRRTRNAAR